MSEPQQKPTLYARFSEGAKAMGKYLAGAGYWLTSFLILLSSSVLLAAIGGGMTYWQQKRQEEQKCQDREERITQFHREHYSPCMRKIYRWNALHDKPGRALEAECTPLVLVRVLFLV